MGSRLPVGSRRKIIDHQRPPQGLGQVETRNPKVPGNFGFGRQTVSNPVRYLSNFEARSVGKEAALLNHSPAPKARLYPVFNPGGAPATGIHGIRAGIFLENPSQAHAINSGITTRKYRDHPNAGDGRVTIMNKYSKAPATSTRSNPT
jgi:hypothetical protein